MQTRLSFRMNFSQLWNRLKTINRNQYLFLSAFLTFIYSLPLVLCPYNFMDDMSWASNGDLGTLFENARPFAVYIYWLITGNRLIADIYPFSILCSFIILYYTYIYLADRIVSHWDNLTKLVVFTLFLVNPFYLQVLSYKYFCLPASISLLLASYVVFKEKSRNIILDFVQRSVLIFLIFCIYQPVLSFVAGLLAIRIWVDLEKQPFRITLQDSFLLLLNILLVFMAYKLFIADRFLHPYFTGLSKTVPLNRHLIHDLISNIKNYLYLDAPYFHKKWILFSSLSLSVFFIYGWIWNLLHWQRKKIVAVLIILPLLMMAITSANIVLQTPLYHLREIIGFSTVFVFLYLFVSQNRPCLNRPYLACCLLLVPCSFYVTSFLYSCAFYNLKALVYQKNQIVSQEILRSVYYFGTTNVHKIGFVSDDLELPAQKTLLRLYPLLSDAFDRVDYTNPWYSGLVFVDEFDLQKSVVVIEKHFPAHAETYAGCYTISALKDGILYIQVGHYCRN